MRCYTRPASKMDLKFVSLWKQLKILCTTEGFAFFKSVTVWICFSHLSQNPSCCLCNGIPWLKVSYPVSGDLLIQNADAATLGKHLSSFLISPSAVLPGGLGSVSLSWSWSQLAFDKSIEAPFSAPSPSLYHFLWLGPEALKFLLLHPAHLTSSARRHELRIYNETLDVTVKERSVLRLGSMLHN